MDKPTFLNDPLRNFEILQNLDDYQFAALKEIVVPSAFKAGEMIVEEGDKSDLLWFLVRGSIEVIKQDRTDDNEVSMTRIDNRCVFGEISFLHSYSRTASVRALTDCGCVSLSRKDLEEKHPDGKHVLHEMTYQIARINTERVLDGDEVRLANLRSQTNALRDRINSGTLSLITVLLVAMMTALGYLLLQGTDFARGKFGLAIFGVAILPIFFYLRKPGHSLADYGITRQKFSKSLMEGIGAALLIGGAIFGALFAVGKISSTEGLAFDPKTMIPRLDWFPAIYLIYVLLQEFVCRGVVQTSLRKFFGDESGFRSVLLTAAGFGLLHVPAGIFTVVATSLAGILFGFFYLRHQNLIGVWLLHYVLGLVFWPVLQAMAG